MTLVVSKQSGDEHRGHGGRWSRTRLKEIQADAPKDIHIEIINDQSIFIKSRRRRDSKRT